MKALMLALMIAFGLPLAANAEPAAGAPIEIASPWARATPGGAPNAAVYLTIVNRGRVDDRLVALSTPVAAHAELHRTVNDGGVMKMEAVDSLEIRSGRQAVLRPGGYHIMLVGLHAALKAGESFPLALQFEHAGRVDIMVRVQKVGAMGPDMGGMKM